ncbi:insulinase family protein [uncultured Sphingomonas sp.]|uniref:insulinase family protein n=1 Tax=uncultured Sphingomonas sp. TaxID=158754 RepID=UPI0025F4509B|nr:insulinase family protein [uncultured Sphingomonas sp.]
MRFAILSRKSSEPGVSVLMRNEGGFIAERRPGERGLAHLIEHVAFHSPTLTAAGDYDHLRRIGVPLTLPAPNAGSTSWRETNYYLSTRTTASSGIDAIRGLYQRLYRPENMTVVIVGDVKPDEMKALIAKRFGNWRREPTASRPAPFPMFERARIRPLSFSAMAEGRRTALMTVVLPTPAPATSRARQARSDLMDLTVIRAINNRLAALQPASRPGKVGMLIDDGEQGQRQILLWDNFDTGDWRPAIAGLRRVTCDLTAFGFTTAEWDEAERAVTADLERRAADMAKVSNVDLAKDLSHALVDGRYPMSAASMLRHVRRWLPRMDHPSGTSWWRRQWGGGVQHLRVETPALADTPDPLGEIRRAAAQANVLHGCAKL